MPPETLRDVLLREELMSRPEPVKAEGESAALVDIVAGERVSNMIERRFRRGGGVHADEKPSKPAKAGSSVDVRSLTSEQREKLEYELWSVKHDEERRNRVPVDPASDEETADLVAELGLDDPYAFVDEEGWWAA